MISRVADRLLRSQQQASRPLVWLIGFFAFLNVYAMQAVLPLVMQDFHASPLQAGYTVGATVLAVALVSPFMGMFSDAWGRRWLICCSLIMLAIPTLLISQAQTLPGVVILRFWQGLCIPGIVVVLSAYMAEEFSSGHITRMTTAYVGGSVMGGFSGRFITGHAGAFLGWRGAFILLAILNLLGACLACWKLPASRQFVANRKMQEALRTLWRHGHNLRLLSACAVGFCVLFSLVGAFTYVNFTLAAAPYKLGSGQLANVFAVYLIGVVATPLSSRFIQRAGFRLALVLALGLAVTGLMLTLFPSLFTIVLGLALCATGVFICQSATMSFIASSVSEGRSLASGLYYLCYYAGGAVGTWVVGLAFERYGWDGAVLVMVGVQLLAAALAWRGWHPQANVVH